jgi:hypothetical protein
MLRGEWVQYGERNVPMRYMGKHVTWKGMHESCLGLDAARALFHAWRVVK